MIRSTLVQLAFQGLIQVLIISAPPVLLSLFFGLMVALFQAATQIQEQSLAFAVKLIVIILTLLFMGGFLGSRVYAFAHYIFTNFPGWTARG
ncbi:MAG: Flagellar biosynthetic protein FliQ [Chlamydiae bacterium]|nr:Flagellar biosynthetic protein FliQ [Chlamydiota bacterium]